MGPVCRCLRTEWCRPGTLNLQGSEWFSGEITPSLLRDSSLPPQPGETMDGEKDGHVLLLSGRIHPSLITAAWGTSFISDPPSLFTAWCDSEQNPFHFEQHSMWLELTFQIVYVKPNNTPILISYHIAQELNVLSRQYTVWVRQNQVVGARCRIRTETLLDDPWAALEFKLQPRRSCISWIHVSHVLLAWRHSPDTWMVCIQYVPVKSIGLHLCIV